MGYPPSGDLSHLQTFSQNVICRPVTYVQLIWYLTSLYYLAQVVLLHFQHFINLSLTMSFPTGACYLQHAVH